MVLKPIACASCHETDVVKHGQTADGKQRFFCQTSLCTRQTFLLEYVDHGRLPDVKQQIVDMTMNGSGIRDIARVLHISPTTVIETLKKEREIQAVNQAVYPSHLQRYSMWSSRKLMKPKWMRCGVL